MGHRLVKDDSPGSIGPTRTGVRMAVLTDRAGGASSMSKAMMKGGQEPRVAACARAWTTLWKALGQEAGSRSRSPPVGVCPERVCGCFWGIPLFLAETLLFPSLSLKKNISHGHILC